MLSLLFVYLSFLVPGCRSGYASYISRSVSRTKRSKFGDSATVAPNTCPAPPSLDSTGAAAAAATSADTTSQQPQPAVTEVITTASTGALAAPAVHLPQVLLEAIQAAHREEQRELKAAAQAEAVSAAAAVAVAEDDLTQTVGVAAAADETNSRGGRRLKDALASDLTGPPRRLAQEGPFTGVLGGVCQVHLGHQPHGSGPSQPGKTRCKCICCRNSKQKMKFVPNVNLVVAPRTHTCNARASSNCL